MGSELKNKFVYQLLLSASQVFLPLISYPYIARVLGPVNLGKVNYVDFLAQICMIVAAFGIPFYAVREIAIVRNDVKKRAAFIQEMVLLHSIFAFVIAILFLFFTYNQWGNGQSLYIFAMVNILLSSTTLEWYFQGMEAFSYSAIRTISVRILILIAIFIFIQQAADYPYYTGIFTAGYLLITLLNCYKVLTDNYFHKQSLSLKKHLKPLWHFFLTSSAISIYLLFDTIILKHISQNDAVVGYYTTAVKLVKVSLAALLVIGTVLLPRISYLAGIGDIAAVKKHINKSILFIITMGMPISTALYLLAPEIIEVVTGAAFKPAVPIMKLLSVLPLAIGLSNVFAFQILVPFKKETKFLIAAIIGCIVSITFNILLIPFMNAAGAAWANIITEVAVTIVTGWYAYKVIPFKVSSSMVLKTVFASAIFIPLIFYCRKMLVAPMYILPVALVVCLIVYVFVQRFMFKNEAIIEIQGYFYSIFKKQSQ